MNRSIIIPLVCCLGLAISAQAAQLGKVGEAEYEALKRDTDQLQDYAYRYSVTSRGHLNNIANDKERVNAPIISHLIRSIDYTRRAVIEERLSRPSDGQTVSLSDVRDAHKLAYSAIDDKLVELGKAVQGIYGYYDLVYNIELLIANRLQSAIQQAQ